MANVNKYNLTPPTLVDGQISRENQVNAVGFQRTALGDTIDPVNDGIRTYPDASETNLSASALIKNGSGRVHGIVVNSHTSGNIKLWDSLTATGTVMNETITLAGGERWIPLFGGTFGTGLFLTIGGTANVTIYWN